MRTCVTPTRVSAVEVTGCCLVAGAADSHLPLPPAVALRRGVCVLARRLPLQIPQVAPQKGEREMGNHKGVGLRCRARWLIAAVVLALPGAEARAEREATAAEELAAARQAQAEMVKRLSEASAAVTRAEERETKVKAALDDAEKKNDAKATVDKLDEQLGIAKATTKLAKGWNDAAAAATQALTARVTSAQAWQKAIADGDAGTKVDLAAAADASTKAAEDAEKAVKAETQPRLAYLSTSQAEPTGVGDSLSEKVLLLAGLVTLNPYKITTEKNTAGEEEFKLQSSKTTTRAFVQVSFSHAWAWSQRREVEEWSLLGAGYGDDGLQVNFHPDSFSLTNYLVPDDLDVRLGYAFNADDTSGAAVVGGGDLSGEASWAHHVYRTRLEDDTAVSFSLPAASIGLVTGREVLDIHPRFLIGTGVSIGTPVTTNVLLSRNRRVYISWRAGVAWFDVPRRAACPVGEDDCDFIVAPEHGFPDFKLTQGYANEFEFRVPIGSSGFLTATGSFLHDADPNPWTFQVGYTVQLAKAAKGLADFLGVLAD